MLIKNGYVLKDGVEKKDILVEGTTITAVGTALEGRDIFDASGYLIMPGLVNAHTHLAMTLFRGYADDVLLQEWLRDYIWPKEMKLTPEDCYYGNVLGIIEMVKSGTTCFNDMYFFEDQAVKAVKETGVRAVLSPGMANFGIKKRGEYLLRKNLEFIASVKDEPRIDAAFAPHSPYTCSPDFLLKLQEEAINLGKLVHIHLHENRNEIKTFQKNYKKSPIELLESSGFFNSNVCAAHVVHVSDKELTILKKHNVKVLHCPASNLKLANGIAPVTDMIKKGICVSLGTDGAASNNTLDLVREMRLMALLQKLKTPKAMTADTAVKIATENGGIALRKRIGRIEKGFLADLIFIDLKKVSMNPRHNLVSNVVYSANSSAIDTVMVDGEIIMKKRKILTVNEEEIIEKAREHAFDVVTR